MTDDVAAAVLAGGPGQADDRLRAALRGVRLIVAADAGMELAEALGVRPDLWVGDFDSVSAPLLERHRDVPMLEHPKDKDELDLELAIAAARQRGATRLVLGGVFDGRLDQTLAALLIAARLREEGVGARLYGGEHEAHVLAAGDALPLALPRGTLFSLLSLRGLARVDVKGARFPLEAAELPFGVGLGLSNRATDGPTVTVRDGTVAVIIEWGEEATA
ncbi:MAG: thiamine diphosphokinase [Deinococcales bacterium]